jgi:wobble nucleotide-excising tRNase
MIKSISVKNFATFDMDGVQINDLNKVNFMYGANGSGKTTISNFIATPDNPKYQDCEIVWAHNQPLRALIYNKNFRENNFGNGTIEGVFTLGQATKEDVELIKAKTGELKEINVEGQKLNNTLGTQKEKREQEEQKFKDNAWLKVYKKNEFGFKEAFVGVMQKEKFKDRLLLESDKNSSDLFPLNELKEKSKTIFGDVPIGLDLISPVSFDELLEIEKKKAWTTKIVGKADVDIAALIQKLNIDDWVHQGVKYLKDDDVCPFCQQNTITKDYRKMLEEYFEDSYLKETNEIKKFSDDYNRLALNTINELIQIEAKEKVNESTKLNVEKFSSYLKTLSSQFGKNEELVKGKNKEPSRHVDLVPTEEQINNINSLISEANVEIKKHNEIVNNYDTERRKLIIAIWKFLTSDYFVEIGNYKKTIKGLDEGIVNIETKRDLKRNEYQSLNKEINKLNENVTSIEPTIVKINKTLKTFGFNNFEIVPSATMSNHYQLQREDGEIAESSLSEGEITFITFLYFMQLAQGSTDKKTVTEERILVIDDPISSLDSSVLFVVSTIIKGIISDVKNSVGNIRQVVILTHNVYFHKEASFVNGRVDKDKNTFFWILRKNDNVSNVQPFEMVNPIKNSYELLWSELRNTDYNSAVTIQNTMRRIIENYFKILGKYGDDDLIKKFGTHEEQDICRSLICWINDGSHSIPDDLFIEAQEDTSEKYLKIFEDIFTLTDHKGHYDMMMEIEKEQIEEAV